MDAVIYIGIGIIIGVVICTIIGRITSEANEHPAQTELPPKKEEDDFVSRFLRHSNEPSPQNPEEEYTDDFISRTGKVYSREEHHYWSQALHYIYDYAVNGQYDLLYQFILNILNDKDNHIYAYELFQLIDHAIINIYAYREHGNCTEIILDLGYRGFALLDDYIEEAKGEAVWRYPTKIAIILERLGRIEEAIDLCACLAERGVIDTTYNNFEIRRRKLLKKHEKTIRR